MWVGQSLIFLQPCFFFLKHSPCCHHKGQSRRYEYFVEHNSKHEEASRCCKNPSVVHTSNRKKIFVNFESKRITVRDKKTKTLITRTYPPGIYMECFKGCNADAPKMAYKHQVPKEAPKGPPACTITPSPPPSPTDDAFYLEVPKHDVFSIDVVGVGTFTHATPFTLFPYSMNPIPKIKKNTEATEYYQAMGVPLEVRCYMIK